MILNPRARQPCKRLRREYLKKSNLLQDSSCLIAPTAGMRCSAHMLFAKYSRRRHPQTPQALPPGASLNACPKCRGAKRAQACAGDLKAVPRLAALHGDGRQIVQSRLRRRPEPPLAVAAERPHNRASSQTHAKPRPDDPRLPADPRSCPAWRWPCPCAGPADVGDGPAARHPPDRHQPRSRRPLYRHASRPDRRALSARRADDRPCPPFPLRQCPPDP